MLRILVFLFISLALTNCSSEQRSELRDDTEEQLKPHARISMYELKVSEPEVSKVDGKTYRTVSLVTTGRIDTIAHDKTDPKTVIITIYSQYPYKFMRHKFETLEMAQRFVSQIRNSTSPLSIVQGVDEDFIRTWQEQWRSSGRNEISAVTGHGGKPNWFMISPGQVPNALELTKNLLADLKKIEGAKNTVRIRSWVGAGSLAALSATALMMAEPMLKRGRLNRQSADRLEFAGFLGFIVASGLLLGSELKLNPSRPYSDNKEEANRIIEALEAMTEEDIKILKSELTELQEEYKALIELGKPLPPYTFRVKVESKK